ncbi:hypothetical protein ACFUT3_33310 [Streptomyces cinereoruber]|uniref:hypothetical protein n=1 Tax=Streptomyces cinereoruber TaxID=67260 RepID=UPI00362F43F2
MQITHLPGRGLVAAVISSIGIRHGGAHALVTDGLYLDLSRVLRNPADDLAMRYRTSLDANVHAHVLATPGALELILRTAVHLRALADDVTRHATALPKNDGRGALADVILRETNWRLSVPVVGTARCVQNRARLIRALYARLDRLTKPLPTNT